jgi:hypothetical protein
MPRKTRVVSEAKRAAGRAAMAARRRDPVTGRLLPRPPADPGNPSSAEEPVTPDPPEAPPFDVARRPWNPFRRRADR